jgi:hypothetical protein
MQLLTVAASCFNFKAPTVCSPLRPQSWCVSDAEFYHEQRNQQKEATA